jgi:hypothetical protein
MPSDATAEAIATPPATPAGASSQPAFALPPSLPAAQARLEAANRALWTATLTLMMAFLQTPGPAHRHHLARRIARNLEILSGQDSIDRACRASFARLAGRWQARAAESSPRETLLDLLF